MPASNGGPPAAIAHSAPEAIAQNTMIVTAGRRRRCANHPPNGIDTIPTQSARLVNAPAWASVMPPRSFSRIGTKLKYPTTPALNEPHIRPAAITGATIRHGGNCDPPCGAALVAGVGCSGGGP